MSRKYIIISIIMFSFFMFATSVFAAEDVKVIIKKANSSDSSVSWISLPYGKFKMASELAAYVNKDKMVVKDLIKWLPQSNSAIRYSYKEKLGTWVGTDFEIVNGEAIGIVQVDKKIAFRLEKVTAEAIILKELGKETTYAVSLTYKKYNKLSDIAEGLKNVKKIGIWSGSDNKISGLIYNKEDGSWTGIDHAIGKHDAVFITLQDGAGSVSITP